MELLSLLYLCAAGFGAAGLLGSLHQWITSRPPQFALSADTVIEGFGSAFLCVFAGPFIVMRNAIRGRRIERRPIGWLIASAVIALFWSLCSGIVLVDLAGNLAAWVA